LRPQVGVPGFQQLRAFGHETFEIAIDRIDLLDHQRHRPIGTPPVTIEFFVSEADKLGEPAGIHRTRRIGRLGDLLDDETVHG
jgi:hypothetical protein